MNIQTFKIKIELLVWCLTLNWQELGLQHFNINSHLATLILPPSSRPLPGHAKQKYVFKNLKKSTLKKKLIIFAIFECHWSYIRENSNLNVDKHVIFQLFENKKRRGSIQTGLPSGEPG